MPASNKRGALSGCESERHYVRFSVDISTCFKFGMITFFESGSESECKSQEVSE